MKHPKKNLTSSFVLIAIVLIALITVISLYFSSNSPPKELTFEDLAKQSCGQPGVASVSICNSVVIRVETDNLGGGASYRHRDGTTFACPVVSPDSMSANCRTIYNAELLEEWNCIKIC